MDRRIVLAGLAAAIAAPAFAQQSGGGGAASGAASGAAMTSGSAARAGQLGQAEMQHAQQTLQLGQVALETSRLAQQKATNENLKQFAQFEVEEQTTMADILRGMMDPAATAATGNPGGGQAAAPAAPGNAGAMPMDLKGRDMIQKLSQASGQEFDREYLKGQIDGHRDLLQVQERYLQGNSQNREHVNLVKMARGRIQEHIAILEDMQKTMK